MGSVTRTIASYWFVNNLNCLLLCLSNNINRHKTTFSLERFCETFYSNLKSSRHKQKSMKQAEIKFPFHVWSITSLYQLSAAFLLTVFALVSLCNIYGTLLNLPFRKCIWNDLVSGNVLENQRINCCCLAIHASNRFFLPKLPKQTSFDNLRLLEIFLFLSSSNMHTSIFHRVRIFYESFQVFVLFYNNS